MFRLPRGTEITPSILEDFLSKHTQEVTGRYEKLKKAYESKHDILYQKKKDSYKPDNRIVANFPKYIVDTTNGFFIGNPIKHITDNEAVADYVEHIDQYNDQDDNNAELSKLMSIHGKGFEMYYADENAELCITYLTPLEAFMIYDESIIERPMYFVRRYTDYYGDEYGSISNSYGVRNFKTTGGFKWLEDDWQPHHFEGVPATEFIENAERQSLFEPILTMVNAYNKALSEKANDVDYFADAYLKVLGAKVDKEDVDFIRDNRIVNFEGEDGEKVTVEFMSKPSSDETQEHFLDRLERLIFQLGQTANVSDENFGTSSGIAILYKMWSTSNLARTKERKFASGYKRRYKLLFSHPLSKVPSDAWLELKVPKFTPNVPANLLEEAQIAATMEGITSHEKQLEVLSVVDNTKEELDRIKKENQPDDSFNDKVLGFGAVAKNATTTDDEKNSETEKGLNNE